MFLQREVGLNRLVAHKVDGARDPADLMAKYLKRWEIETRLNLMGMSVSWDPEIKEYDKEEFEKAVLQIGLPFLDRR